jgi:hypothetical protein
MTINSYGVHSSPAIGQKNGWSFLTSPWQWQTQELLESWEALLRTSGNVNAMYQSPQWCECLDAAKSSRRLELAVLRNSEGVLVGINPLSVEDHSLHYGLGGLTLARTDLQAVFVMGGQPLLPNDASVLDDFFGALASRFPDCQAIALSAVPIDSFLWRYLHGSRVVQQEFFFHCPDGPEWCHTCALADSFDAYLSQFSAKKRYNLKRQVKILRKRGGGKLELQRVTSRTDIPNFRSAVAAISPCDWSGTEQENSNLLAGLAERADRGLLRCYTLKCGEQFVAWLRGYEYGTIYHIERTRYNRRFGKFSPGTVLLYLVVEDLIRARGPRLINFGYGAPVYRHQSCNATRPFARVLLLRKNLTNCCRRITHLGFRRFVKFLKKRMPLRSTVTGPSQT